MTTALADHARQCDACRVACVRALRTHTALLRTYEALDAHHDQQRDALMAALPPTVPGAEPRSAWAGLRERAGELTMRLLTTTNLRKTGLVLLPAACLVAALVLFLTASPKVAFAEVLERMRSARTMVCDVFTRNTQENPAQTRTNHGHMATYSDGGTQAWLTELESPPERDLRLPGQRFRQTAGCTYVFRGGAFQWPRGLAEPLFAWHRSAGPRAGPEDDRRSRARGFRGRWLAAGVRPAAHERCRA